MVLCETQLHLWRVWYFSFSVSYLVSGILSFQFDNQSLLTAKFNCWEVVCIQCSTAFFLRHSNMGLTVFDFVSWWRWNSTWTCGICNICASIEDRLGRKYMSRNVYIRFFSHPWINAYHIAGAVQKTVLADPKTRHDFHSGSEGWTVALWEKTNIKRKVEIIYIAITTSLVWL